MPGKIFNCFISAVVGAASAVGTVWFLTVRGETSQFSSENGEKTIKFDALEVGSLKVGDALIVVDPATGEPTIELRGDSIFAQKGVYAEQIGAFRVVGQKVQATPDDPLDENSPIFCELATNEDGGAYVALLSPRESHSVTIGFDKSEKGCVLSQNNDDSSMVAQAIFLKPTAQDAASETKSTPDGAAEKVGASKPVVAEEENADAATENPTEKEESPVSEIAPSTETAPQNDPLGAEISPFPAFAPEFEDAAAIGETL